MIDPQINHRIESKILDTLLLAQSVFKRSFDLPKLEYRQMGRAAGWATYSQWKVTLNSDYLRNGHLEDMVNQTLPHELAHLISYSVYGPQIGRGHGRAWKHVMRSLGLRPDRCHDYSLEGVKTRKKAKYACKCPTCGQEFLVTLNRVHQLRSGRKIFHSAPGCRSIKAPLVIL